MRNNRKNIKNRGFTITEVITTLVILGVVLVIAIPSVGKLQEKFKGDYYEQLNGSVVAAAKTYFKDNAESRPKGDLAIQKLDYASLTGSKYIDSINEYKGSNPCTGYIAVLKVKDQYTYTNCMKCESGAYKTYDSDSIVDIRGIADENAKKEQASSNVCALANKNPSDIDVEYNTTSLESLYLYSGSYSGQDLKEALAIDEKISLMVGSEEAYSVSTGNKIYPKNITGIDLSKETINHSSINTGIKVEYDNTKIRTIHVYDYERPIVSNSNGKNVATNGVIRSATNNVILDLSSVFFKSDVGTEEYPEAPLIGTGASKLTPEYNGGSNDEFENYYYSVDGTTWKPLNCIGKHYCEIASTAIEKASKIKFKMKLVTPKGTFEGKETGWYDLNSLVVVTFNANGGNIDSGQTSKEVETNEKYGSLPVASKIGHSFEGWQTETNGGSIVTENAVVTNENDHTLYAKWDPITYTLTLNANGGSVSPTSIAVKYDKEYGTLPTPTRTGYTFNGWYTSLTGGTQVTSGTKMGAGNTTIYARWTPISSVVTLNANGGSVSPSTMTVQYDSTYGAFPTPTRTGYTFVGWFNENYKTNSLNYYADAYGDLKNAFGYNQDSLWNHYLNWGNGEGRQISQYISSTKVKITSAQTLYAGWIANSYVVTLNANGGSVSTSSLTLKYGSQYGTLPEPTRANHVFNGWYTASSGGTQIASTSTMNTASNHTLYAQWTEIITVTKTDTTCSTSVSLPDGVYYIEIAGGGAGGHGYSGHYGGNSARWAGYVYLPGATSGKVCVGKGSSGTHGFIGGTPNNGDPSYIANNSGAKLIEAMGGINYSGTYSNAITNIGNGAVSKLECKNIKGKTSSGNKVTYGYGGSKSGLGRFTNASSGKAGIIIYQYVKSLDAWNSSPLACPSSTLCSSSDCGW